MIVRVAEIAPRPGGGSWVVAKTLAKYMDRLGADVELVSPLGAEGVRTRKIRNLVLIRDAFPVNLWKPSVLRGFDVVHLHGHAFALDVVAVSAIARGSLGVLHIHGLYRFGEGLLERAWGAVVSELVNPVVRLLTRRWLKVVSGRRDVHAAREIFGEAIWMPTPVDLELFRYSGPAPGRRIGIVVSGRLSHKLGGAQVEFVRTIRAIDADVKVVSVGSAPIPGTSYVGKLGHEEMPRFYSSLTALAILSRSESVGLPALEAMACGVPVAALPSGDLPITLGGGRGILRDDPRSLAEALAEALLDREALAEMGARGREYVERYCDPSEVAAAFLELFSRRGA